MTDLTAVVIALVAMIPAAIAAVASLKAHSTINEVKISIDGRMDQLLTAMNAQGRQEQRAETRQDEKNASSEK